ncbi:hypothetical protein N9J72_02425 [Candidatus Gracilibacteria bacterium]|nr:hypothetical protein [Candidatus Gracilibacteria bacterium]
MKNAKQIFASVLVVMIASTNVSFAALDTVSCESDPAFAANSCNQCFDGGTAAEGDNKGFLTDIWENNSDASQVVYKEEQVMPKMIPLNGSSWTDIKASDSVDFWQYTPEFEALYSDSEEGYVLDAGESVTWIESTLGSAYQLSSSSATAGQNVGLLTYDIGVHNILAGGEPAIETDMYRECVLIKSGVSAPTQVTPTDATTPTPAPGPGQPTVLPETGPEYIFLALAALLLGFGFFYMNKKA